MIKHHWKHDMNYPYLGVWDLPEMQPMILTIAKVVKEMTKGLSKDSIKNVAYFKEKGYKPMIINSTNSNVLSGLSGSVFREDWINIPVKLRSEKTRNPKGGGEVDGLRIAPEKVKLVKEKLTKDHARFEEIRKKYQEGTDIATIKKHFDVDEKILKY